MTRTITIVPALPKLEQRKRVAAYARVSSGKDAMLHSLSAQVSYYSSLIQKHGDWLYVGVYADEAKTGTKPQGTYPFTSLLVCENCGKHYKRKPSHDSFVWICSTLNLQGKSVLSAKLVCEDCGSFYGSKVWHSTDKYRRTIWRCNSKFDNEQQCTTPTVDEETVRRAFITAYNQLMRDRSRIVADCELMRRALVDLAELDAEIERQQEETQVVAELVKAAVQENASTAQSQDAYLQKYEALTKRYETAAADLERLKGIRAERERQDQAMALFIRTLKRQPEVLDAWSDTIWTVMVERVLVHRNGGLTFQFYNGSEIRIGA